MSPLAQKWDRNPDVTEGSNIIDPPVIREYERRIADASAEADTAMLEILYEDYSAERERIVERIEGADDTQDDDRPRESWSRPDLNAYAREVGVIEPEKLGNKQEVLKAIEERDS